MKSKQNVSVSKPYSRNHIPQEQIKQIKAMFDLFDTDGGGFIDSKQIKQAMISLGFQTKNNTVFNMLCDLDEDGNGVISFNEWVGLMTNKLTDNQSREHLRKIFRLYDTENEGFICANRLKEVAKQLGQDVPETEIIEMLKRADLDVDGLISQDQFYQILTRK